MARSCMACPTCPSPRTRSAALRRSSRTRTSCATCVATAWTPSPTCSGSWPACRSARWVPPCHQSSVPNCGHNHLWPRMYAAVDLQAWIEMQLVCMTSASFSSVSGSAWRSRSQADCLAACRMRHWGCTATAAASTIAASPSASWQRRSRRHCCATSRRTVAWLPCQRATWLPWPLARGSSSRAHSLASLAIRACNRHCSSSSSSNNNSSSSSSSSSNSYSTSSSSRLIYSGTRIHFDGDENTL